MAPGSSYSAARLDELRKTKGVWNVGVPMPPDQTKSVLYMRGEGIYVEDEKVRTTQCRALAHSPSTLSLSYPMCTKLSFTYYHAFRRHRRHPRPHRARRSSTRRARCST